MNSGQKIYNLRKEYGYSQEELAVILGVTSETVSQWENGTIPKIEKIIELSNLFNVSIDYLLKNNVDVKNTEEIKVQQIDGDIEVNKTKENAEYEEVKKVEESSISLDYKEVAQVKYSNATSDALKVETYLNSKKFQAKQIFYGVMFIFIATTPLILYYYDLLQIIQNEQLSGFMSIIMLTLTIAFVLKTSEYFKAAKEAEEPLELNQYGKLFLNKKEKIMLEESYEKFNVNNSNATKVGVAILIVIYITGNNFISMLNRGNLMRFITLDALIILAGYSVGLIISIKYEKKAFEIIFENIVEIDLVEVQEIEKEQNENQEQEFNSKKGVEILNVTEVDEYINGSVGYGKFLGKVILFLTLGSIPFIPYFYSDGEIFNSTTLKSTPISIWALSLICNLIALYLLIKLINVKNKFEAKNDNDFILNELAENKLKFVYEKFKTKKRNRMLIARISYLNAIIFTISLGFIFNDSSNIFYILLSVTMFLYAFATYFVITVNHEQKAYKVLLNNVA